MSGRRQVSLALLGIAVALVGNLATNLVDVRGVWRLAVFVALGGLILAVVVFMRRTRLSYREYADLLQHQNLDATLRQQVGADHPGVLKATRLSLEGLAETDPSGDAARLLRVLSVLSPGGTSHVPFWRQTLDRPTACDR